MPPEGNRIRDNFIPPYPTVQPKQDEISNNQPKIFPSVLDCIGNTPLIRLNKIPQSMGIECEVLVKCEFYGPGGSHKDRIALQMVEDAEKQGKLLPGMTIIEPTSGNTGIALALVAAVKGYKTIFVTPEKNSQEKFDLMAALGAKVIKTPNGVAYDGPYSHVSVAKRLQSEISNSIMLDQYENPGNPKAHYEHTATEILNQTNGQIDMIVIGAGTGGAISGIGKRFKESCTDCTIIAVDPEGSIQAAPASMNTIVKGYEVEGIGHADFIPKVLDYTNIDKWVKTVDKESLLMARRLIQEEGLLVGASCGAAVCGAIKAIKEAGLKPNQRCVILLPDGVRNYMTKFISDSYMLEKGFLDESDIQNSQEYTWWNNKISELNINKPASIKINTTIQKAIEIMQIYKYDQITLTDSDGTIKGVITLNGLLSKILSTKFNSNESVEGIMNRQFKKVTTDTCFGKLLYILQGGGQFVIVTEQQTSYDDTNKQSVTKEVFKGIVTQMDLVNYIASHE